MSATTSLDHRRFFERAPGGEGRYSDAAWQGLHRHEDLPITRALAGRWLGHLGMVCAEDFFRHIFCHRMFFQPVVLESLDEVRYDLPEAHAREAVRTFRAAWDDLDARWATSGFPASYEIASGIQY